MENAEKNRKMESVSAEDLKKIVKRMIKKTLDDNEHMVKLHRKVCKEWCSFLDPDAPETPQKSPKTSENPSKNEYQKNPPLIPSKSRKKGQNDEECFQKVQKPPREGEIPPDKMKENPTSTEWRQRAWEYYSHQKRQQKGWKRRKNSELNVLLNQLDLVLHQKYLREHRHHVQSFYCQPTYYGTELPEALFRQQCMQYGFTYQ